MRAYRILALALLAGGVATAATTLHRVPRSDAAALAMLDPSRLAAAACAERAWLGDRRLLTLERL